MRRGRDVNSYMFVALAVFIGFLFTHGGVAFGGDLCAYRISIEKAAAILGIQPGDLKVQSFKEMVSPDDTKNKTYQANPCRYGYSSKSNFLKRFSYVVHSYNHPKRARRDYDTMKRNFSTAAKVVEITRLGDASFYVRDKRFPRLLAVKADVLIDVMNPGDVKLRKKVAALVLRKVKK